MTQKKFRGLMLAALMVMSVFASAGVVSAAGTTDVSVSPSSQSVSAGQTTTYDVVVNTASGGVGAYDFTFSTSDAGVATITDVQLGGNPGTEDVQYASDNSSVTVTAALADTADSGSVTIATVTVTGNAAGSADMDLSVNALGDEAGNNYDVAAVNDGTVTVESTSGGDTPSEPATTPGDDNVESGETFWMGQELYFDASNIVGADASADDRTFQIRSVNSDNEKAGLKGEFTVSQDDRTHLVDTSDLEGDYVIVYNGEIVETNSDGVGSLSGQTTDATGLSWEVAPQSLDVTFDDDKVLTGDTGTFEVDSNRGAFDMEVSADGLDADELASIFADEYGADSISKDTEDDIITISDVTSGDELTANFADISAGNYTFEFEAADTTASSSDNIVVNEKDVGLTFASSSFSSPVGDNAEISVNLEDTDTGYLFVGGPGVNYLEVIEFEDGDDDGEVTLEMNTFTTGQQAGASSSSYSAVADDDEVVNVSRISTDEIDNDLDAPLESGDYDLRLASSDNYNAADDTVEDERDVAVLNLQDRSTTGVKTFVASTANADADELADLQSALSQSNTVVIGDRLVVQVEATGIYGYLDSTDADDKLMANGVNLTLEQSNPAANQEGDTISVDLSDDDVELVTDEANNTFYVVLDTRGFDESADPTFVEDGDEYDATFTLSEEYEYIEDEDSEEEVTTAFEFADAEASFDNVKDSELQVVASDASTVSGTTNLAPGTEITVRARASGDTPFLKSKTVEVGSDGAFSTEIDFSDANMDVEFTVAALKGSTELEKLDAVFVESQQTTKEPTTTTTKEPTTTTTKEPTTTTSEPSDTTTTPAETTSEGQAGFGVALALIAVIGAALLALRREN